MLVIANIYMYENSYQFCFVIEFTVTMFKYVLLLAKVDISINEIAVCALTICTKHSHNEWSTESSCVVLSTHKQKENKYQSAQWNLSSKSYYDQ